MKITSVDVMRWKQVQRDKWGACFDETKTDTVTITTVSTFPMNYRTRSWMGPYCGAASFEDFTINIAS
jgi:hypothetical protein